MHAHCHIYIYSNISSLNEKFTRSGTFTITHREFDVYAKIGVCGYAWAMFLLQIERACTKRLPKKEEGIRTPERYN